MSLAKQIQELRTKRAAAVDVADKIIGKAYEEKRSMTAEEEQQFDRAHKDAAELRTQIDQHEKQISLRADLDKLAIDERTAGREDTAAETRTTETGAAKRLSAEERKRLESLEFRSWLNGGVLPASLQREATELRTANGGPSWAAIPADQVDPEIRSLNATTSPSTAATGTGGSTLVPQGFVQKLEVALKYFGGIVDAAEYIDTDNGAPLPYPTLADTSNTGEQTAENAAVSGSDVNGVSSASAEVDPTFGVLTFNAWMIDSGFVRVPIQLMQDSAFDVEAFLADANRTRIGRKLNTLCTTGAGTTTAKGVVVAATLGVTATPGNASSYAYNDLIALFHSVDPAYRDGPKVGFMTSDSGMLEIRKVKDSNNRPLFIAGGTAEGIQNGAPETIFGKRYWINNDMAAPAAAAKSLLFGDFSKYKIRRVRQLAMLRVDQLFAAQLQIGFLAYQRFDGNLLDAGMHPIKYLLHGAT